MTNPVKIKKSGHLHYVLGNEILDIKVTARNITTSIFGLIGYYVKINMIEEDKIDLNLFEKYVKYPQFQFEFDEEYCKYRKELNAEVGKFHSVILNIIIE